ncbi:hypothetical protein D3C78_1582880 [compost metagenome]
MQDAGGDRPHEQRRHRAQPARPHVDFIGVGFTGHADDGFGRFADLHAHIEGHAGFGQQVAGGLQRGGAFVLVVGIDIGLRQAAADLARLQRNLHCQQRHPFNRVIRARRQ